ARVRRGVGVDRKEQVGALFIGERGTAFERDKRIVGAGVDDFAAHALGDQGAEALGDVEHELLFHEPVASGGAVVVAAVAGVDHNAGDFESERADEGAVAARSLLGGQRRWWNWQLLRGFLFGRYFFGERGLFGLDRNGCDRSRLRLGDWRRRRRR